MGVDRLSRSVVSPHTIDCGPPYKSLWVPTHSTAVHHTNHCGSPYSSPRGRGCPIQITAKSLWADEALRSRRKLLPSHTNDCRPPIQSALLTRVQNASAPAHTNYCQPPIQMAERQEAGGGIPLVMEDGGTDGSQGPHARHCHSSIQNTATLPLEALDDRGSEGSRAPIPSTAGGPASTVMCRGGWQ